MLMLKEGLFQEIVFLIRAGLRNKMASTRRNLNTAKNGPYKMWSLASVKKTGTAYSGQEWWCLVIQ